MNTAVQERTGLHALRDSQVRVIGDAWNNWHSNPRQVLFAPGGSGKTVIASHIAKAFADDGQRLFFVVHRDSLAEQAAEEFRYSGHEVGLVKGNEPAKPEALIQVASAQSMGCRNDWYDLPIGAFLFDEIHRTLSFEVVQDVLNEFDNSLHMGLTATPWRLQGPQLGDFFPQYCSTALPAEMIQNGELVPHDAYRIDDGINFGDLAVGSSGEYTTESSSVVFDTPESIKSAFDVWVKFAYGLRTIGFCVSKRHAQNMANYWCQMGIPAVAVTSSTPVRRSVNRPDVPIRSDYYRALKDGRILAIFSVDALSEGFNVQEIECVIEAASNRSRSRFYQRGMRGQRIAPWIKKKKCVWLDQGSNILGKYGHGLPEWMDRWELPTTDRDKKVVVALSEPPSKYCINNDCRKLIAASAKVCPHCGEEQPKDQNDKDAAVGEFTKVGTKEEIIELAKRRDFWDRAIKNCIKRDKIPDYAAIQFQQEFGDYPGFDVTKYAYTGGVPTKINDFKSYLKRTWTKYADYDSAWAEQNEPQSWLSQRLTWELGENADPRN